MRCTPCGPKNAKIALVGEAPGAEEERLGTPFVGGSGQELNRCLSTAGINRDDCWLTNVFLNRPPGNKLHLEWCRNKIVAKAAYVELLPIFREQYPTFEWPNVYNWSSLAQGRYLMPQHLPELIRLRDELVELKPNLVIALGGTPTWALLGIGGISKLRGAVAASSLVPEQKVLPTWHPAYVQRVWTSRSVLITDLMKAKSESQFANIVRPSRKIWINPCIADIIHFRKEYIEGCDLLSFDSETANKQITCISFAPRDDIALIIPFVDRTKPSYHYWESLEEEVAAWKEVRTILNLPMPKLAQNGLYDLQYLWRQHHIPVRNFLEDLMLLHHSIFLELPKDLGFLGSVYTSEPAWKLMRTRVKDSTDKKDE